MFRNIVQLHESETDSLKQTFHFDQSLRSNFRKHLLIHFFADSVNLKTSVARAFANESRECFCA